MVRKIERMDKTEEQITTNAIAFAKTNKTKIAKELTDKSLFPKDDRPVSVFMSGSPGAGKTEASKAFLEELGDDSVIRLDPDDLRERFDDYTGDNSYLFHSAISLLIERALDRAFNNKQSFLLDGTLSSYKVAEKNIERSLRRKRAVLILFVYQHPSLAWEFVQAREQTEGRRILPKTFIDQFFGSQEVIRELKVRFGNQIEVDLLVKNNVGKTRFYHDNIQAVEYHIGEKFTREELEVLIK